MTLWIRDVLYLIKTRLGDFSLYMYLSLNTSFMVFTIDTIFRLQDM